VLSRTAELPRAHNVLVMGSGLGYLPLLLRQSHPALRHLYIADPSISIFRTALHTLDLTDLLRAPEVRFIIGAKAPGMYQTLLQNLMDLAANSLLIIDNPPVQNAFPAWTQEVRQQINDAVRLGKSGLATKFRDAPLTIHNLIRNLEWIETAPGIREAGELFQGVPAIIVAAGPSLALNVDRLREAQRHFLILASDTAYNMLINHGVVPHFVVTVDPTALNLRHFPAERYGADSFLLFDPEARPEIVRKFPRPMTCMTDKHPFFAWLELRCGGKGVLRKGGMVSQAAMQAALHLGCSPLILVGQDLALDPQTCCTHAPETALSRRVAFLPDNPQQVEIETPERTPSANREPLYWVEGVYGGKVPTVQSFLVYLRLLEEDLRQTNVRVIDATEGGARILGTSIRTLAETLQTERRESIRMPEIMSRLIERLNRKPPPGTPAVRRELQGILRRKAAIAQEGIHALSRARRRFQTAEDEMEAIRRRIFNDPVTEYLVENTAPEELFDFMKLGPADAAPEERREHLRRRYASLFNGVLHGIRQVQEWLEDRE
jgi:hypothetical protein